MGLSKYREGLYPLESFTKEDAKEVLSCIHRWQDKIVKEYGIHFVHASDEWYLLAEEPLPKAETYDGYLQLENGVGMLRLLHDEFLEALREEVEDVKQENISIITGFLASDMLHELCDKLMKKYPEKKITIYPIKNNFFGEQITVSGLLTYEDITQQLEGRDLGDRVLLPCNVLRSGEDVFLDDYTLGDLERTLQVKADIVKSSGQDLFDMIMKKDRI